MRASRFPSVLILKTTLATCSLLALGARVEDGHADQMQTAAKEPSSNKVSMFGRYEGYTNANQYDGYQRHSVYVPMRDGVRLAVDYFLPTKAGKVANEPLPVVFNLTPYGRAYTFRGETRHLLTEGPDQENLFLALSRRGYVIATADTRGQGASFGGSQGPLSAEDARDGHDLVQWFAEQPWSSGDVGMYGVSYMGTTQYLTASENPPALKALFPAHAVFDNFEFMAPNGVYNKRGQEWLDGVDEVAGRVERTERNGPRVAPIDGPEGEKLFSEAQKERVQLDQSMALVASLEEIFAARDASPALTKPTDTGTQTIFTRLGAINEWDGAIYHWGAWNDYVPLSMLHWFQNFDGSDKITISAATHHMNEVDDPRGIEDNKIRIAEAARWFDHWLKGVDNGVMDDPRVNYAVQSGGHYSERDVKSGYSIGSWAWRTADGWPVSGVTPTTFSFADGSSGSISSVNDGLLTPSAAPSAGRDDYDVDETVSTGLSTRVADSYGAASGLNYPDMRENDQKSLTYTTKPLANDVVVIGSPVVTVYATSTAPDGAIFAHLEEVDPDGYSTLVSFGAIQASHRTLGAAPFDNFGDPWPTSLKADITKTAPFNGGTAKLEFALQPTATRFAAGNRIRLSIAGADVENYELIEPDATLTVFYGGDTASSVTLPIVSDF